MKLLVDMNLSPRWVEALRSAGIEARHWSAVGDGGASDTEIFARARRHGYVVFTHDLDFSRLVALAGGSTPSIVLLRTHRVLPEDSADTLVNFDDRPVRPDDHVRGHGERRPGTRARSIR